MPVKVEINRDQRVNADIAHQYAICEQAQKIEALVFFLKSHKDERGIVFCKTKRVTKQLHEQLTAKNYQVGCIHGDLKQIERDKVMRAFKGDKLKVLIATDISARGIDVDNLAYVFHYQLPDQVEYYTHRKWAYGSSRKERRIHPAGYPKRNQRHEVDQSTTSY